MQNNCRRLNLKELNIKMSEVSVVGIIIRKQNVRKFPSKKNEGERGVWNFTLRDSITEYINVTCWGSSEYISILANKFCFGDVVLLVNPKIGVRQIDDVGEQYRPQVTSPYTLTLNENSSRIDICDQDDYHRFLPLLHYPTKFAELHLTLGDISVNGGAIRCEYVDLLVAVRSVSPVKKLKAKNDGREIRKRDVVILDQTNDSLRVTLWDTEFIERAEQWKPRETILFVADMKVDWSNYERRMIGVVTSRSVITEDPLIPQAEELRKYARTVPFSTTAIIDHIVSQLPDPSTIRNIMTVQRVVQTAFTVKKYPNPPASEQEQFTALVFGFITSYDLDGLNNVVITRCDRCSKKIDPPMKVCINLECPVGSGVEQVSFEAKFEMIVCVTDHTGTLKCRLSGKAAEKIIGKTVDEFKSLSSIQKEVLKWKYLMERCAVRLIVLKRGRGNPLIAIISWELANPAEVSTLLPIY